MSYSKERVLSRKENGNYSILFSLGEMKLSKLAALQVGFDPCEGHNLMRRPSFPPESGNSRPQKKKRSP